MIQNKFEDILPNLAFSDLKFLNIFVNMYNSFLITLSKENSV